VFKTTVSNAAYQLSDLTSHLLARAGDSCVCRGSYSDIVLAAYTRRNFVTVEGINSKDHPATAFQSEQIIKAADQHSVQQQQYRGQIHGAQPDASVGQRGNPAASVGSPLGTTGRVTPLPNVNDPDVVSAENPPTTADPNDLPGVTPPPDAGLDPPPGGVTSLADTPLTDTLTDITGLSDERILNALNGDDPEALALLEETTGSSGAELQEALTGPVSDTIEFEDGEDVVGQTPTGQNLSDPEGMTPQEIADQIGGGTTPAQVRSVLLRGTAKQIASLEAKTGLTKSELYSIFGFGG